MADTATATFIEEETPTQKQARLRREKRQAKLATTGEDRLAKIKQLNGGVAPPDEVLGGPALPKPSAPKAATVTDNDDPDEVDISSHPYMPANGSGSGGSGTPRAGGGQEQDPLMQAMLQMQGRQGHGGGQAGDQAEMDPMAQMMQQMMGMMGGDPNDPNALPGEMPQIGQMLSTMMGGAGGSGGANAQIQPASRSAYLWRITHAIFASLLAGYVALTSTFNGTQLSRTAESSTGLGLKPFIIFTTAELVLQTMRYYMEGGQLRGGGWLATIANSGFVPSPYAHYIRTVGSYMRIYTTIVSDAMVILFVLGCMAWWRGAAVA